MGVFGIPYVFRGSEHFWKVLEGEIGQELLSAGVHQNSRVSVTTMLAAGVFTPRRKAVRSQTI